MRKATRNFHNEKFEKRRVLEKGREGQKRTRSVSEGQWSSFGAIDKGTAMLALAHASGSFAQWAPSLILGGCVDRRRKT